MTALVLPRPWFWVPKPWQELRAAVRHAMAFQPGFRGAARLTEFTFVGSAVGSTPTIDLTSLSAGAIAAGDFSVIFNGAHTSQAAPLDASPGSVIPSGFTECQNTAQGTAQCSSRLIISAKILAGTETTLTGMNSIIERWIAAVWRPSAAISAFAWNGGNGQLTTNNPSSQTIAAGSAGSLPALLAGHMWCDSNNDIDPRSTSPTMTEISGAATHHYAHWFQYTASPANHSYDMNQESFLSNGLQSGYFTFTP